MSTPSPHQVESSATVFVVDDDPPVLDALTLLMDAAGYGTAAHPSAESFLEHYDEWREGGERGCLVLDVRMPGMDGVELQRRLRERGDPLPIIFLTGHGDVPMAVRAVRAGAVDFLLKPFRNEELLERVAAALDAATAEHRAAEKRRDVARRLERLTPRERQVMERVIEGDANRDIAQRFGVSQRTVELHRARVMQKMNASSLAHLVRMTLHGRDEVEAG